MTSLHSVSRVVAVLGMMLAGYVWLGDPVRADVLMPNQKQINYCFEVTGMDAFPDYIFLAYFSRATGGHTTIDTGKCVSFYKLAIPMIYAMRRSVYATNMPPSDRQAEQTYFTTNPNLLRSDVSIRNPGAVDKSDPVDDVVDVFHVVSVDDTKLNVVPESVRYTFSDGKKETVPWTSGDRPAPSRNANAPAASATSSAGGSGTPAVTSGGNNGSRTRILFALGVTVVALIAIVGVIVLQERQRGPRPPTAR